MIQWPALDETRRKLTAALKTVSKKPDAWLFCGKSELNGAEFDPPQEMCGLPVFYSDVKNPTHCHIPWLPIWKEAWGDYDADLFNEVYDE